MKAYTDIKQSKKLAEILPLESADMFYTLIDQGLYLEVKQGIEPSKDDIPCWSLTALLATLQNQCDVLETRLRTNKKYNVFAAIGDFVYNSFEEHPNDIDRIERYAVLATFRDVVKARWSEYNGSIKEMQIKEKEKELAYHKNKITEIEKELKELK